MEKEIFTNQVDFPNTVHEQFQIKKPSKKKAFL